MSSKLSPPGLHWWMLGLTALLAFLVFGFVDLKPVVDENFFFSGNDAAFRESKKIDRQFPTDPEIILNVSGDLRSGKYAAGIGKLTRELEGMEAISKVKSLSAGPKSLSDALASPFWHRLLIPRDGRSSNVIAFVSAKDPGPTVRRTERLVHEMDGPGFRIHIAGPPFVVEMIRRSLAHDFRYFSLTAFVLFGITMAVMFQSLPVFLGMISTCSSAVLLTLLLQSLFGEKIGVLTVNLGTIVFVIALSHLVYMAFNWQTLAKRAGKRSPELAAEARRMTFPASFWSMVCSSLGFGSLLLVQAKPLRELGFGGVLGTVIALGCAYLMYPAFLRWDVPHRTKLIAQEPSHAFWSRRFVLFSLGVIAAAALLAFGLTRIDTDPSLLDYFKKGGELRDGLEAVDQHGGANPLTLVVANANGRPLDNDAAYARMWSLQSALEQDRNVGTVISLPTLLAEGDRVPFSFFISYRNMINLMNEPKRGRIARSFVSDDRTEAVFLLRMREEGRTQSRLQVVDGLKEIVRRAGFRVRLIGGIYYLQGRLAQLVASSLVTGLFWLNLIFIGIAWFVARSLRGAVAMIGTLTLVPICMLGGIGWFHLPLDIISAPATNVCIGIAIDSMIHLVFGVRRAQAAGKKGWAGWIAAREEQWRGIVYSDVIIAAGFAIFLLSDFPPTQRFGLVVLAGTIIDILGSLFVLPLLGGAEFSWKRRPAKVKAS
ncbi:MAG TPA: MMPL family transporter [Chthoniobacterales bacterium]|jgi:predicted RND superfamily exporter protein|nr:MMPL family transporter [Chthoniobacterales bacterium]